jgi:ankyrin repeat protein
MTIGEKYLQLARNPIKNKMEIRKILNETARIKGYNIGPVFHGADPSMSILSFDPSKSATGILWFTDSSKYARFTSIDKFEQGSHKVYSVYLSINNPLDLRSSKDEKPWDKVRDDKEYVDNIKKQGYDGILLNDINAGIAGTSYVVFDARQVKSADLVTYHGKDIISLDRRFDKMSENINESVDDKYMILAKDPVKNTVELQQMVKDAAFKNGYTVHAYHGTRGFTGNKFNRKFSAQGIFWFSEDRDKIARGDSGASGRTDIMEVYLKTTKVAGWPEYEKLSLGQIEHMGFDSIHLDDDWVIFDEKNIKSANVVTYKNRKIVPLSSRFNSNTADIRENTETFNDFLKTYTGPFYHGTGQEGEYEFDIGRTGTNHYADWGKGIYLSPSKSNADSYRTDAVKASDKELQQLHDEYSKEIKGTKSVNGVPQYSEKANELISRIQKLALKIDRESTSGQVVEIYLKPTARIAEHSIGGGEITDTLLADHLKLKGFDAVKIYDRYDDGRRLSELVVMNPKIMYTRTQLMNIWKQTHNINEVTLDEDSKYMELADKYVKGDKTVEPALKEMILKAAGEVESNIPSVQYVERYDSAVKGRVVIEIIKDPDKHDIAKIKKDQPDMWNEIGVIVTRVNSYAFRRDMEFHRNVAKKIGIIEYVGILLGEDYAIITDATSSVLSTKEAKELVKRAFPWIREFTYFNETVVGSWDRIKPKLVAIGYYDHEIIPLSERFSTSRSYVAESIFVPLTTEQLKDRKDTYFKTLKRKDVSLYDAITMGWYDRVKELIGYGDGLAEDLETAVVYRQPEIVQLLLDNGADVNWMDNHAIRVALNSNYDDIVKIMIPYFKKEDIERLREEYSSKELGLKESIDESIFIPVPEMEAKARKQKYKIMYGTDIIEAVQHNEIEYVKKCIEQGRNLDVRTNMGRPLLIMATTRGLVTMTKLLLDNGADPNVLTNEKKTPLFELNNIKYINERKAIANLLLDHGVDPNIVDRHGDMALHYACVYDMEDVVDILLEHGAKYMEISKSGRLPLPWDLAINNELYDIVKVLLKHGMDINYQDSQGATALIRSVVNKRNNMVDFLLEHGADPNIKTNYGFTALDFADGNIEDTYNPEAIIMLKSHGAKNAKV